MGRNVNPESFTEIGKVLGISAERARQHYLSGMAKLSILLENIDLND